jgi:hypothetical protein
MPDHRHVKRSLLQGEEGKKKNEEEMGGGSYSRHENARQPIVRDRHRRDLNGEKLLRRVITTKIMCCNISSGF